MNKSQSKYFSTAVRMDEALMRLLEKKDFEYISVKEICAEAGVNRSTFYLHYENTRELLDESLALMNDRFVSYFAEDGFQFISKLKTCPKDELLLISPEYLRPYLTFIEEHKTLYSATLKNPSNFNSVQTYKKIFEHVFDPILERFSVPEYKREYLMLFYVNGITAMVREWLNDGCRMSIDNLMEIIIDCIPKGNEGENK